MGDSSEAMKSYSKEMDYNVQGFQIGSFDKWKIRYNLKEIKYITGQVIFEFNGEEYYYSFNKNRVRKKGDKKWLGTIFQVFGNTPAQVIEMKETMRFGQYKGRPIKDMLNDQGYCFWLFSQDWFEEKNPDLLERILERYPELKL